MEFMENILKRDLMTKFASHLCDSRKKERKRERASEEREESLLLHSVFFFSTLIADALTMLWSELILSSEKLACFPWLNAYFFNKAQFGAIFVWTLTMTSVTVLLFILWSVTVQVSPLLCIFSVHHPISYPRYFIREIGP